MIAMIGNALLLALRELRRNVMRSILTMLGIIIGVASVIILVTLGSGATKKVTQQIASLGSNLLMLSPGKRMGPGQSSGAAPFKLGRFGDQLSGAVIVPSALFPIHVNCENPLVAPNTNAKSTPKRYLSFIARGS